MNKSLVHIDNAFAEHYRQLFDIQNDLFGKYKLYAFDLNKTEITEAIRQRMMSFWYFNVWNTKNILERQSTPSGADFLTETCLLFFKAYFETKFKDKVVVNSEKSIVKKRNAIRPDISVWNRNETELIAAIELKLNDNWKRGVTMQEHLAKRENDILIHYPRAYFAVVSFWNFFDTNHENWRTRYVGLYNFDKANDHPSTGGYIEDIMKKIEEQIEKVISY